jgi:Protein of unknown function (DUF3055)
VSDTLLLYDNTEQTSTRFIGFFGVYGRYDVAVITTGQFYGKKLVCNVQTGRSAILDEADASNVPYLMKTFALDTAEEGTEFSEFLLSNL